MIFWSRTTAGTRPTSSLQWTRSYAKAAKGKPKAKSGSQASAPKIVRVSRTELRKRSVILTATVPGVGEIGEELKVTRGFARNFLFAKGYAKLATDELRQDYAEHLAVRDVSSLIINQLFLRMWPSRDLEGRWTIKTLFS